MNESPWLRAETGYAMDCDTLLLEKHSFNFQEIFFNIFILSFLSMYQLSISLECVFRMSDF